MIAYHMDEWIIESALKTPEPRRAERNLQRLAEVMPIERLSPYISEIAQLFASSQFLANFSIRRPKDLLWALDRLKTPPEKKTILEDLVLPADTGLEDFMDLIRVFKKRWLLRITLRDILGITDIEGSMRELTSLSEVIIEGALKRALIEAEKRYGEPPRGDRLSVIGLGKLGGEELNYSSDIDIIFVYDSEEGQTSGVLSPTGVRIGRLSTHEFYIKVVELFSRILSQTRQEGPAYRVDLRLRPQGQKGELSMPLSGYADYYESWGRTWEKMVLLRARPVAGDLETGIKFMEIAGRFLWGMKADYSEIEDIRSMKKKIDATFLRDDIKRGWGGIREAEFFVQTFQLLYGADISSLRAHRLFEAIEALKEMSIVPEKDLNYLWQDYLYLRRVEHYLQMMDDLQVHTLPSGKEDLDALSRRLGHKDSRQFLSTLKVKRMQIKSMYNSLLGTKEDINTEAQSLLEEALEDEEIEGFLSFRGISDIRAGLMNLKKIREGAASLKRELFTSVMPELLEEALRAENPDRAIAGLEGLFSALHIKESHLTAFSENRQLLKGIVKVLALSPLLSRALLSDPEYLNRLIEEFPIRKTLMKMRAEIARLSPDISSLVAYKTSEEIRLGAFFLMNIIKTFDLLRYLSHLAEASLDALLREAEEADGLSVIALGKLGGREITFGSDLDIVFVSEKESDAKRAEDLVKSISSYTPKGLLYQVDLRLRPDGSKGAIVKTIEGYRDYYEKSAWGWEIQALLRARHIGGSKILGSKFMAMAREIIIKKGREVEKEEVSSMRKKIIEGASKKDGIDIKLGPGGIEEIEFYAQWLALRYANQYPSLIVQNTTLLIRRLGVLGLLNKEVFLPSYEFLRRLETFLRLNEVDSPEKEPLSARFMGFSDIDGLIRHIEGIREGITKITGFL